MALLRDCRLCPRLANYRDELQLRFPDYHDQPVEAFGPRDARLTIVGLAPGLHGANNSGRPFTGDASGDLLFKTLFKFGFASQGVSRSKQDGMRLFDCRISNAVKCVPPKNRPNAAEVNTCNLYLREEIETSPNGSILLALGKIAHEAISIALGLRKSEYKFAHCAQYDLPRGLKLVDSYHCSQYMTHTGRLTPEMFDQVFVGIRRLLG